tara:strand:- start:19458 stop:22043 length:2586 start_codon:yes stop_codon:yes gene_type:complete
MANIKIPTTNPALGVPSSPDRRRQVSQGELIGDVAQEISKAFQTMSLFEDKKTLAANPLGSIVNQSLAENINFIEYDADGRIDYLTSLEKADAVIEASTGLLEKSKQEASLAVRNMGLNSVAQERMAIAGIEGVFKSEFGDADSFKQGLRSQKVKLEMEYISLLSGDLKSVPSKVSESNPSISPVNIVALENAKNFLSTIPPEDVSDPRYAGLISSVVGAENELQLQATSFGFLEAINMGPTQAKEFAQNQYVNVENFDKWMSNNKFYDGMNLEQMNAMTRVYRGMSITMPKEFVSKVVDPFILKTNFVPAEEAVFTQFAEIRQNGSLGALSETAADRIDFYNSVLPTTPTSESLNETLTRYSRTFDSSREGMAKSLKDFGGANLSEYLTLDYTDFIWDADVEDVTFGVNLSNGAKQSIVNELNKYEMRALEESLKRGALPSPQLVKQRALNAFKIDSQIYQPEDFKGILNKVGGPDSWYMPFPDESLYKGQQTAESAYYYIKTKLMDQLKLDEVDPEVRERKAIEMLKEGFMKTDPLIPDAFVLEYNGGDVVTVFGEELAMNSFDPEFAVDVDEFGDGYGDFLKASLGIAPDNKEQIDAYHTWKFSEDIVENYPYTKQAKDIIDNPDFKSASPELQKEILDYVGQRINLFTKKDPLKLNPDFLEMWDGTYDGYFESKDAYYRIVSNYTPEQRAEKMRELKNRSLDFSTLVSYEDRTTARYIVGGWKKEQPIRYVGPKEIPNSKVMKAFEHRFKRMSEPVTIYSSAPNDLSSYYGAVETSDKAFIEQMVNLSGSVVDSLEEFLNDPEALSDFNQIDIARMLVASTFDPSTAVPDYVLAMTKSQFVSLARKIVKEGSKDAVQ